MTAPEADANGGDNHRAVQLCTQSRLLARHVQHSVFSVSFAGVCIVYVVGPHVGWGTAFAWWGLVVLCLGARSLYARSTMKIECEGQAAVIMRHLVWFAALNGLAVGCSAPLFFHGLPDVSRAVIAMVLIGLSAGGIATSAAYPPVFLAYIIPALLPLTISWFSIKNDEHWLVGLMIILFATILTNFVRDNYQVFKESFHIRFEREALIAQLEKKQQELQQAKERAEEAGQAKARVLAAASHDLRQPLHALSLYSAVLNQQPEPAALSAVSSHIDSAVRALSALLNALLDISKLDAGVYQIEEYGFDAKAQLARIVLELEPMARNKGLMLYLDAKPAEVYSDPVVFERMARNLIENAIKYTDSGAVVIRMLRSASHLRIEVADTGKGIPAGQQQRIFEEFYQLDNPGRDRERGLGLGLSIVKRLAQLVGSTVELTSTLGQGSCFAWQIPLHNQPPAQARATEPQGKNMASKAFHVLVIEDEIAIQHGMGMLLKIWGMHPYAAATESEAGQILAGQAMDLIIADLRLQNGVSGLLVAKNLACRWPGVPVLLISGETDPGQLREVADSGYRLLTKPLLPEVLHQTLIQLLEPIA